MLLPKFAPKTPVIPSRFAGEESTHCASAVCVCRISLLGLYNTVIPAKAGIQFLMLDYSRTAAHSS